MRVFLIEIHEAIRRARSPILWMALTYALGVATGATMVHARSDLAISCRDHLVGRAQTDGPAAALRRGLPLRAASLDFATNLGLGAVPSTIMGLAVALPFPQAAYRGWVGGIVSVDGNHNSRLTQWREGIYYLGVLILQLIPYSLAGGTGVRLGLAFLMPKGKWGYASSERRFGLPAEGLRDVVRIYALIVPFFLVASLVEFLAR